MPSRLAGDGAHRTKLRQSQLGADSFDALSEKSMVACKLISGSELLYRFGIWNPIDPVASGLCIRTVSGRAIV